MPPRTVISPQKIQDFNRSAFLQSFNISTPVCRSNFHMWDVVTNLEGSLYSANAVFVSNDAAVSSIEIARTQDNVHTVAFFGTEDGFLKKVYKSFN